MAQTVGLLPGNKVHQPTQHQSGAHKRAKNLRTVNQSLAQSFLGENREYHRNQEGEYDKSGKVCYSHCKIRCQVSGFRCQGRAGANFAEPSSCVLISDF